MGVSISFPACSPLLLPARISPPLRLTEMVATHLEEAKPRLERRKPLQAKQTARTLFLVSLLLSVFRIAQIEVPFCAYRTKGDASPPLSSKEQETGADQMSTKSGIIVVAHMTP